MFNVPPFARCSNNERYTAGTPKKTVGFCSSNRVAIHSGVAREVSRMTAAPAASGNDKLLPSPYAKKSRDEE